MSCEPRKRKRGRHSKGEKQAFFGRGKGRPAKGQPHPRKEKREGGKEKKMFCLPKRKGGHGSSTKRGRKKRREKGRDRGHRAKEFLSS